MTIADQVIVRLLDALWSVRRLALRLAVQGDLERARANLSIESRLAPTHHQPADAANVLGALELQVVRGWLRRFPMWIGGHVIVAERSLVLDQVASSYAAAQAIAILSAGKDPRGGRFCARAYVRRGLYDEALSALALGSTVEDDAVRAECYLGLGEYQEALACLQRIPQAKRSYEMEAAMSYAATKLQPES